MREEQEIRKFVSMYSTFFEEFKEAGISCWLFYLLYVLRRTVLMFSIKFATDAFLQITIALASSISVINIQVFMYLLATMPFRLRIWNYFHLINEFLISIFYAAIFIKLIPRSSLLWEDTTNACKYVVIASWILNVGVVTVSSIIKIVGKLRELWRNRQQTIKVEPIPRNVNYQFNVTTLGSPNKHDSSYDNLRWKHFN